MTKKIPEKCLNLTRAEPLTEFKVDNQPIFDFDKLKKPVVGL